ncbi:MAG TPA: hypothetical protein VJS68_00800 [Thermoplasmata archaeon]|nr:hypothetical protein [Thermoplasmata archaeon]
MPWRLHRDGKFRSRLGQALGGDFALGDRAWRRILHGLGAGVLLYYVLPPQFFILLPTEAVLLLAFAAVIVLETLRHVAGLELPTIRPYEQRRLSSFFFYATALVVAVLVFPPAVATVVVLGTALVDPLIGELRSSPRFRRTYPVLPLVAYAGLGSLGLVTSFHTPPVAALALSGVGAFIAVAVERPKAAWVDDDIAMTLVPGVVLTLLILAYPAL